MTTDRPDLAGSRQRRDAACHWFGNLRERIVAVFESIEDADGGPGHDRPPGRFERRQWTRAGGGGGVMAIMRGRVFEKVGVNISTVWGDFEPKFAGEIPGTTPDNAGFWATGISLVAHMRSPHVPGVHMNTRHITTAGKAWFGGGTDLNPPLPRDEDTKDFHAALAQCCGRHPCADYAAFSRWADDYFTIPHRGLKRGVGGIFYDDLRADEESMAFTRDVGETFLAIYPRLVHRRMHETWTDAERSRQLQWRGRYAEFNLVYDRGTRFGLMTGANPEAVLMSLPPVATWP